MTRDEQEVVSELRRGLIQRIGRERFDLWFGTTVRLQPTAGQLVVRAGSQFVLDRLRKQFVQDLEAAGRHVLGDSPQLVFRVEDCPAAGAPEQSEPCQPRDQQADAKSKLGRCQDPALKQRSLGLAFHAPARFARLHEFVVGSGNRIAHSAAGTVSERLGAVSPLFLYGPSGCGKTHLLQGIWSSVRQQAPMGRVLSLSAEQFTTHFLEALRGGGLPSFRRKCRDVQPYCVLELNDRGPLASKKLDVVNS